MSTRDFDDSDLRQLQARGITIDEVQHQLLCFERPPYFADVVRPCTIGDGIQRIAAEDCAELLEIHARASAAGRLSSFVPASGAATRMFAGLIAFHAVPPGDLPTWDQLREAASRGDAASAEVVAFVRGAARLPFRDALDSELRPRGMSVEQASTGEGWRELVAAVVSPERLGYARFPKALVPFHRYPDGEVRTAFEEHLVEASELVREERGLCRLHFTVPEEHLDGFATLLREVGPRFTARRKVAFDVGYSLQKPSTDTLAVDLEGRPFRTADGKLLFRPSGHGALIDNLEELEADVVLIKNIDNVRPEDAIATTLRHRRLLTGLLVRLQASAFALLHRLKADRLADADLLAEAEAFVAREFGAEPALAHRGGRRSREGRRAWLIERLDRPMRVCGVVPNTGEPGGGPFWVRDAQGLVAPQIVETAHIDPESELRQRVLSSATHFNPVDLVCGLRDAGGRPYPLHSFLDTEAVFVGTKSAEGRPLRALERPGLWNGAMAGWNTLFVELPAWTFAPVKTVLDLARPEHLDPTRLRLR